MPSHHPEPIPTAADIMTRKVITVGEGDGVHDAVAVLLDHGISGAPVVGDDGKVVGMLTEKDCMSYLIHSRYYGSSAEVVSDFMNRDLVCVGPTLDIFALAAYFLERPIRRLPVLDDAGNLIGIVSRSDVLRASRRVWDAQAAMAPDPGYLSDAIKARLGSEGVPKVHRIVDL